MDELKMRIAELEKENKHLKDKTQIARNYRIVCEENKKLKEECGAQFIIDKLNEEHEEALEENAELKKENEELKKINQKYKDEEYSFDEDIRGGNIKLSINEGWILEWLNEAYGYGASFGEYTYKWNVEQYKNKENAQKMFFYRMSNCIWNYLNKRTNDDEAFTNFMTEEMNNGDEIEVVDYEEDSDIDSDED